MTENKIKEVAEMLGIEIGVPFNIKGYLFNPCKLTHNRIENRLGDMIYARFFELLTGELEIEQPILDDIEKRYLENVFRPFKDKIIYIEKRKLANDNYEYILFDVSVGHKIDTCFLPYFNRGTMYKGMELRKQYSLEELGLFEMESRR